MYIASKLIGYIKSHLLSYLSPISVLALRRGSNEQRCAQAPVSSPRKLFPHTISGDDLTNQTFQNYRLLQIRIGPIKPVSVFTHWTCTLLGQIIVSPRQRSRVCVFCGWVWRGCVGVGGLRSMSKAIWEKTYMWTVMHNILRWLNGRPSLLPVVSCKIPRKKSINIENGLWEKQWLVSQVYNDRLPMVDGLKMENYLV